MEESDSPADSARRFADACRNAFSFLAEAGYSGQLRDGGWCWHKFTFTAPHGFVSVVYDFRDEEVQVSFGPHPEDQWLYEVGGAPFDLNEVLHLRQVPHRSRITKRRLKWTLRREPLTTTLDRSARCFERYAGGVVGGDYSVVEEIRASRLHDAEARWRNDVRSSRQQLVTFLTAKGQFWRDGDDAIIADERSDGVAHCAVHPDCLCVESVDVLNACDRAILARLERDGFAVSGVVGDAPRAAIELLATGEMARDLSTLEPFQRHLAAGEGILVLWK